MNTNKSGVVAAAVLILIASLPASAQDSSIFVQCPKTTKLNPVDQDLGTQNNFPGLDVDNGTVGNFPGLDVDNAPLGNFPGAEDVDWNNDTLLNDDGDIDWNGDGILNQEDIDHNSDGILDDSNAGAIKCDHLVAGDGMVTMADGYPQYIFSFARLPMPGGEVGVPTDPNEYASWVMQQGMLAANAPAPTIVVDEDDELFLSLTNVGMTMRPDLFDPHTVHWHGFPQASAIFDGVPDSSVSINMGASLTYYYNAKDAGTYMYHCHVEATEHMQMGMLGNLFVRPRQNKLPDGTVLGTHVHSNPDFPVALGDVDDPLVGDKYAYNDGDGSTLYHVEYPIQIGSFDPDFHDASLNVQPLPFAGMNDRYFMLNGRGYPDTAVAGSLPDTEDPMGEFHESQPVSSLVTAAPGERILLRLSNLNITEFYTIGTNGLPMEVVGLDARLLRDDDGNNLYYKTNSLTLGGGQSADVIIVAPPTAGTYFLYSQNLDRLSNNTENFGGMMTEIVVQ